MRQWRGCAAMLGIAACSACFRGDPTSAVGGSPKSAVSSGAPNELPVRDLVYVPEFSISISANGDLRPGKPVALAITVRSSQGDRRGEVRLVMPEYARQELGLPGGWKALEAIPATATWVRVIGAAGVQLEQTIVFSQPGRYKVIAGVRNRESAAPRFTVGGMLVPVAFHELTLVVSDSGGVAIDLPNWRVMHGAAEATHGGADAFDLAAGGKSLGTPDLSPDVTYAPPASLKTAQTEAFNFNTTTQVLYHDDYNQYEHPVRRAQVSYSDSAGTSSGTAATDDDGNFTIPCVGGHDPFTVTVNLDGPDIRIRGDPQRQFTMPTSCLSGGTVTTVWPGARIWDNALYTVDSSRAVFQRSRGKIDVWYSQDLDISYYSESYDNIHTAGGSVWPFYEDYDWGAFDFAHEYGHAVNEKALGGIEGGCSGDHSFNGYYDLQCAYSEGFADFHSAATRQTDLGTDLLDQIVNCQDCQEGYDGSINEEAVAATLFWLVEPFSPGLNYNGRYVADIVKTCQVANSGGLWRRANGIDDLVYCLENSLDAESLGDFATRSSGARATALTWSSGYVPGTWSQQNIRNDWLAYLYR